MKACRIHIHDLRLNMENPSLSFVRNNISSFPGTIDMPGGGVGRSIILSELPQGCVEYVDPL